MLTGCVGTMQSLTSSQQAAAPSNDTRACAKNFTVEGSAISLSGKKYKTNAAITGVPKAEAMSRASRKLAQDGLNIVTLDREGGLLVASNKVIAGKGPQDDAQFVTTFEAQGGALAIGMRFGTSFGQMAAEESVRENMCGVMAAIEGKR